MVKQNKQDREAETNAAAAGTEHEAAGERAYDWQQSGRPRKIMFAGDEILFAWKNPLNLKSKKSSAIRKALKEMNQ